QQTLHGETPRPKVAESREGCDANADRVWNIGPGRLEDIAAREPSFYEYRQYHGQFANERRVHALRKAAAKAGMVLNERPGHGRVLVELGPPEGPPLEVAAFKSDDGQPVVIVAVDECPETQGIDRCVDDSVGIEIKAAGKVACGGSTPGDLLLGL